MNINLTLSRKNENGDIPTFTFRNLPIDLDSELANDAMLKLDDWIRTIDLNNSVLVCFETLKVEEDFRNEVGAILVSHDWYDIGIFCENHLECKFSNDVNFAVFEFENYEEAFNYCLELREGF